MKKIVLVLGLLATMSMPVMASECATTTCVAPYDLSGGVSRFFSTVTGTNFISQKIAQSIIKKEIKKSAKTDLDVKIKSFSVSDLKAGRFKSMEVSGEDLNFGDVYLSSLEAKTTCDFNYVVPDEKNNTVLFKEALPMAFTAKMSADNINAMVKATNYQKRINELNNLGGAFNLFKVSTTSFSIKDNKFLYTMKIGIPFMKGTQDVTISSDLTVKDGKIALADTKLINNNFSMDITKLNYMLNYLNPLDYSFNIVDNKTANVQIQNVSIKDNQVVIEGTAVVPKDTVN
ncbi:MAG: LmeA family phospholipid-binding protein [Clostridiaceae bacterium]|jgi:hypothetical protein|nr:LmeA family phospholipid-binding protein [Clostridiaceae bacterium]